MSYFWFKHCLICFFTSLAVLPTNVIADKNIVASIRPLELIVSDIVGDEMTTSSVLNGSSSPHHFALKTSHVAQVTTADLFVWVGPELEVPLIDLASRAEKTLTLKPSSNKSHHHGHHEHHDKGLHVWLSLDHVVSISKQISAELKRVYPERADILEKRQSTLEANLLTIKANFLTRVESLNQKPFVVFHDGYDVFIDEFNLNQMAALTQVPEEQIGSKRLLSLKRELGEAKCMLADLGEVNKAEKYAKKLGLSVVAVDLLGADLEVTTYEAYINAFMDQVIQCLSV